MVVYGVRGENSRSLAHELLAYAAAEYWGFRSLPDMERTEAGKPWFPAHPQCCFNLSHSGNIALCALSDDNVGVDVQEVRPWRKTLLDRACSPAERQWLAEREDAPAAFALLWALKESQGKYRGKGLSWPVSGICVPLPGIYAAESVPAAVAGEDGLSYTMVGGDGWQAALCAAAALREPVRWVGEETLSPPRK